MRKHEKKVCGFVCRVRCGFCNRGLDNNPLNFEKNPAMKTQLIATAIVLSSFFALTNNAHAQDGRRLDFASGVIQMVSGGLNASNNPKDRKAGRLLGDISQGMNSIGRGLNKMNGPRFIQPQFVPVQPRPFPQQWLPQVPRIQPTPMYRPATPYQNGFSGNPGMQMNVQHHLQVRTIQFGY